MLVRNLYFYPRPPRGGRRPPCRYACPKPVFLSTPSARRATEVCGADRRICEISIHALREEGDSPPGAHPASMQISIHALREEGDAGATPSPSRSFSFLSTPSARRATRVGLTCKFIAQFLSTPSARRATLVQQAVNTAMNISIHALREEGDLHRHTGEPAGSDFYPRPPRGGRPKASLDKRIIDNISIHALREEGDQNYRPLCSVQKLFLSTPSARRATGARFSISTSSVNFYPRPPRGGRPMT